MISLVLSFFLSLVSPTPLAMDCTPPSAVETAPGAEESPISAPGAWIIYERYVPSVPGPDGELGRGPALATDVCETVPYAVDLPLGPVLPPTQRTIDN